ncbi:Arylesterase family and Six-bladed beta-propeller, TolB-like domain-containing protein [Strongyloides ratti]|uniref:Arylesterase family and Six-bladed beta-propeller, TolB-like domain-containing protein n=1 Tax=Strongyloides ratti TaxID=34506 RepID=A0A090LTI7_STRRB|nr:Arylesterase family and Six-bladed beta-propeller, TolB-like domain-containing protein [Strongyloides ratti]CEF70944.1 Arylesterase family and Six-bladed beta-propeller, TolB-like domain-containing protein [Strongyloides ratti]
MLKGCILIIAIFFLPIISIIVYQIIFNLDIDKRVYNHISGECSYSRIFNSGINNIIQVGDYVYFYTNGENNFSTINAYNDYNNQYFTFSIIYADKKKENQNYFGHLSVYKENLYVINHLNEFTDTVELFSIRFQDKILKHLKTFKHFKFYNLQGISAVGKDSFYLTQQYYFKNIYLKFLELLFRLPTGSVLYYNGLEVLPVANGVVSPKGLLVNEKKTIMFVPSYGNKKILKYRVYKTNDNVIFLNDIPLGVSPVNIMKFNNNEYIIPTHPLRIYYLITHFFVPSYLTPSQVLKIKWNKSKKKFSIEQLYSNDGASMSHIENAVLFKDTLLVSNTKSSIQCSKHM